VGLKKKQAEEEIINYFCNACKDDDHLTEWRKEEADEEKKELKAREYYEVQDIVDHLIRDGKREFLVEWKEDSGRSNIRTRTWEPEEHLDRALDLLQRYCRDHGIALSKIVGLVGANLDEVTARSNWVRMNTIVEKFERMRDRKKVKPSIEAREWSGLCERDGIYFVAVDFYCFVSLCREVDG